MSKIRIKGDTSGYVDLETSASGSNLSIGGNTTVTGDVAINGQLTTTSLGTTLSSNSYNVVKIQTDKDDTSAADGLLQFTHGSANTVKGEIRYDASESMFELGHGDNQGHVRINASGHVTMPYQPMASAGSTMGSAGANRHEATTIYVNKGGTNLAANGRFTCPVAGTYRATLSGYTNYTSGYGYIVMKKNGSQSGYNHHFNHNANNYQFHTIVAMTQLVECAASDYLEFWGDNGNGYVHYSIITFELVG